MTTLKPCPIPWCLSSNVEIVSHRNMHQVKCCDCGTYAPIRQSKEAAMGIWNNRAALVSLTKKNRLKEAFNRAGFNTPDYIRMLRKGMAGLQGSDNA